MRGLIGKKIGMTRIFDVDGNAVPVTVLQAGPCTVTQLKTLDQDGYDAIQVGYGERKQKHLSKPLSGHFDKSSVEPKRILAEFEKVPDPKKSTCPPGQTSILPSVSGTGVVLSIDPVIS